MEGMGGKARARGADKLSRAEQTRMIAVAFSYSSARYRLGVMREAGRSETLLAARPVLRDAIARDERFIALDPENYVAALSIAENVFFGPVKVDRRDSWRPFKSRVDTLMSEIDLRRPILRAGLDQEIGENGASLNASQRRKLGLARALMKNPGALVLDGLAPSGSAGDQAIRRLLRGLLEDADLTESALVWGAASEDAAPDADHVIRIHADGSVSEGPPATRDDAPGAVDGG